MHCKTIWHIHFNSTLKNPPNQVTIVEERASPMWLREAMQSYTRLSYHYNVVCIELILWVFMAKTDAHVGGSVDDEAKFTADCLMMGGIGCE